MNLYSQHDPAFDRLTMAPGVTIHQYGCFLTSLATLYQRAPQELLRVQGGFDAQGNLFPGKIAGTCGGFYQGVFSSPPPEGWCIAQTDHYSSLGYPTHFFCVNARTKQQIDPLKFPAIVEPLSYNIVNYRTFTYTKLDTSTPIPLGPFPDVPTTDPDVEAIKFVRDKGFMKGTDSGLFNPDGTVTRRQLAIVLQRALGLK